jgi:MSHA biogenesis protein MshQ
LAGITRVGSSVSALSGASVGSIQIGPPAGVASGDVMLAVVAQRGGQIPMVQAAPTGWTLVQAADQSSLGVAIYNKVATGSEPASYTWTFGANGRSAGTIVAWRGVDTTEPISASAIQVNAASTTYSAPSITTTTAGSLLVAVYAAPHGSGSISAVNGMTMDFSIATGAGPNGLVLGASAATQTEAGPTGTKLSTGNSTLASMGALLALKAGPVVAGVDHYEVSLPSNSLSCLPSTITVTACATSTSPCTRADPAASGATATLAASGATLGTTTITFNASGVATTTLSYPTASNGATASVALSGESMVAANARKCCPDGTSCTTANSCSTSFSTAGFIVT